MRRTLGLATRGGGCRLSELVVYCALLRPLAPAAFDVEKWRAWRWIGGRRGVEPMVRAATAAPSPRFAALTYGTALTCGKSPEDPTILASGIARAEAMAHMTRRETVSEPN
jgi:hypothetical protein